ncbi:YfgM family protein [Chromatocurvus halotolerans]|uniref:Ancillary SecYEG translocon subunit n=1 Tax=Chromatocurvus halotolerans TaxID=1132028 RepID=A0A4R2KX10_9GAMM|nr:tetratricopeptide repeat protein [Chromatocurvus halotolerans]TCO78443.1 putative negative regulator of RcsB-dependent stress response [Chromatocurvus halotolerans]
MESYRTEEEQVEAIKRWWEENGRNLVIAVAVALSLGFGWQAWQSSREEQSQAASSIYQRMLQAMGSEGETDPDNARALAGQLKSDFGSSPYARFAVLHLARMAVEDGDLARAETELRWVVSKADKSSDIHQVAQLRLARVTAAQGKVEQALAILDGGADTAYAGAYALARGDILMAADRPDEARDAYAVAQRSVEGGQLPPVLSQKLEHLNPVAPRGPEQ